MEKKDIDEALRQVRKYLEAGEEGEINVRDKVWIQIFYEPPRA